MADLDWRHGFPERWSEGLVAALMDLSRRVAQLSLVLESEQVVATSRFKKAS